MPVGDQPTEQSVNNDITQCAVQLRSVCDLIRQKFDFIANGLGSTGLQALGFSSADATTVINTMSELNTVAGVYFGTATQASAFDFDNALAPFWGDQ